MNVSPHDEEMHWPASVAAATAALSWYRKADETGITTKRLKMSPTLRDWRYPDPMDEMCNVKVGMERVVDEGALCMHKFERRFEMDNGEVCRSLSIFPGDYVVVSFLDSHHQRTFRRGGVSTTGKSTFLRNDRTRQRGTICWLEVVPDPDFDVDGGGGGGGGRPLRLHFATEADIWFLKLDLRTRRVPLVWESVCEYFVPARHIYFADVTLSVDVSPTTLTAAVPLRFKSALQWTLDVSRTFLEESDPHKRTEAFRRIVGYLADEEAHNGMTLVAYTQRAARRRLDEPTMTKYIADLRDQKAEGLVCVWEANKLLSRQRQWLDDSILEWATDEIVLAAAAEGLREDAFVGYVTHFDVHDGRVLRANHGELLTLSVSPALGEPRPRYVVAPCSNNTHFVLLVADLVERTIHVYDSILVGGGSSETLFERSMSKYADLLGDSLDGYIRSWGGEVREWKVRRMRSPTQDDTISCGFFVLENLRRFMRSRGPPTDFFDPFDVGRAREETIARLVDAARACASRGLSKIGELPPTHEGGEGGGVVVVKRRRGGMNLHP